MSNNDTLLRRLDNLWYPVQKWKPMWAKRVAARTPVTSLEGEQFAEPGDYLCRGIADELWPQSAQSLLAKYAATAVIDENGFRRFDPIPDATRARAAQADFAFTVASLWGLLSGKAGDYVVQSTVDLDDIWLVDRRIFEASYSLELPLSDALAISFQRVSADSFEMRSDQRSDSEPSSVKIESDYYLSTFPVTEEQYQVVLARGNFESQERRPVTNVSWDDATVFCERLFGWDSLPNDVEMIRLPSEAEWEYACRGGHVSQATTDFYNGDGQERLDEVGWYQGNSRGRIHAVDERSETHPLGLCGMHGNVREWCLDSPEHALKSSHSAAGSKPEQRVLRGGSWRDAAHHCRSAHRDVELQQSDNNYCGFRVCLLRSSIIVG